LLMVRGSWFVARDSWFVVRGSWLIAKTISDGTYGQFLTLGTAWRIELVHGRRVGCLSLRVAFHVCCFEADFGHVQEEMGARDLWTDGGAHGTVLWYR
jgi:hypothetical protein